MHSFKYINARTSYLWNEILQKINGFVKNKNILYVQCHSFCQVKLQFISVPHFV